MIKARKIGLILDREIQLDALLKNGVVVSVECEFLDAEYDRLFLKFPSDKLQFSQYFYENREVVVNIDTLEGRRAYPAKVIYEPEDGLIVVEYYEDDNIMQKRKILRVSATRSIDIKINDKYVPMLTIDISGGGCRLLSSVDVKVNAIVDAVLRLSSTQQPIKMKLRVCGSQFLNAENKYEISVEFLEIRESDRKKIMKFCYDMQSSSLLKQNKVE